MNHKKMVYSGITILAASIFIPTIIILWSIYGAFEPLRTNQTAGIDAVGGSIGIGVISGLLEIIGILTGIILIIVGNMKANRQSKTKS